MADQEHMNQLEEAIHRFLLALYEFISVEMPKVDDSSKPTPSGDLIADFRRAWKHAISTVSEAARVAELEFAAKMETVVDVGNEIKALTGDPVVVNPVDRAVEAVMEQRIDLGNFIRRVDAADSLEGGWDMFTGGLAMIPRWKARHQVMSEAFNELRDYLMLRRPE